MAVEFVEKNFDQEVLKSEMPVIVDFWAPWCGPCQIMGPVMEELGKELEGKAMVGKVNVDEEGNLAARYSVMSIPAIKIFKGGKVVKEFVGVQSKDTLKKELESFM